MKKIKSSVKEVEYVVQSPLMHAAQRRQGLPVPDLKMMKPEDTGDTQPSASEIREIRLQWSDKIESAEQQHVENEDMMEKEKMKEMMMKEKRDKRFLDPDEVSMGHMMDHEGDHDNTTKTISDEDTDEGYGDKTQSDDPHADGQQFCVDISEYLDLKWVLKDAEECHVSFNSQCEARTENVCIDVTETKCEVVPYKECKMGLEPQEYTEKKLAPKLFIEKSCYQGKKTIPHKKLFPECRNVTKQNCVTLWETDENGEQVRLAQSMLII